MYSFGNLPLSRSRSLLFWLATLLCSLNKDVHEHTIYILIGLLVSLIHSTATSKMKFTVALLILPALAFAQ